MSEQAPEAPAGGGGGNPFKRKIGPLPMWAWLAIGAALIGLYVIYKRNQASQAAASTSTADTSTPASDVPQFVNQTYTTVTPPAAPTPTPVQVTPIQPTPVQTTPVKTAAPRPKQITATGEDSGDLNKIAGLYGLTEKELIAANPGLRKIRVHPANNPKKTVPLIGSGLPVPKGTVLKIPPPPAHG